MADEGIFLPRIANIPILLGKKQEKCSNLGAELGNTGLAT